MELSPILFLSAFSMLGTPQDANALITTIDRAEHDSRLVVSYIVDIWLFKLFNIR